MQEKPSELSIDVDQWKRDIQTFAEATSQVLNAIAAELSNECSSDNSTRYRRTDAFDNPNVVVSAPSLAVSEPEGNDRLADLKSQLAKRISKNN